MKRFDFFIVSVAGLVLSGCAGMNKDFALAGYGVSAEPLYDYNAKVPSDWFNNDATDSKNSSWMAVQVSEQKCTKFLNGLVAAETGMNTGLDVLTTVTSGLATAFTPVATSHALSAASTITSGTRTAVDSDVFAKASIANFAQAVQSTYFKDMGTYVSTLAKRTDKVNFYAELPQIQSIHSECALGSAEATISTTLQGSSTPSNSTASTDNGAPGSGPAPQTVGNGAQPSNPNLLPPPTTADSVPGGVTAATTTFVVPGHPVQHN